MKLKLTLLCAFLGSLANSPAAVLLSGFSSYADGALVGKTSPEGNVWTQIGSTVTNPLTITTGMLSIAPSGQAAANQLLATGTDAGDFFYGGTLNLSAAQTGNTFLSFSANNTGAPGGGARLTAQASGAGYVLGLSVGTDAPLYGTTVQNFNTNYRFVFHYNLVAGSGNDSSTLYVNPTSSTEAANTVYSSRTALTGLTALQFFEITQTSSTGGPTGRLSNFVVSTTFAEAAAVPEPTSATFAMVACGIAGLVIRRRARKIKC